MGSSRKIQRRKRWQWHHIDEGIAWRIFISRGKDYSIRCAEVINAIQHFRVIWSSTRIHRLIEARQGNEIVQRDRATRATYERLK